ncbi:MAG: hypothetical protein AAGF24_07505 [Cyanobacteria bacterium P01_H01_bin.121]
MTHNSAFNRKHESIIQLIQATGPWPFITQRIYQHIDESMTVWRSREHRKGLSKPQKRHPIATLVWQCLWLPQTLNWWIGIIFALGANLFIAGSVVSLNPTLADAWSLNSMAINAIFFTGSIPFTIAAYLQLFQAANARPLSPHGEHMAPRRVVFLEWRPHDIGWLSCALQFPGTLLFNLNTFDAFLPSLDWLQQDLEIWIPNLVGSLLFLLSGYCAFVETCHAHWAFKPRDLSWWLTLINGLGCICFMISALFAFVTPHASSAAVTISLEFTLFGATAFLIGSLLMLPETVSAIERT